MHVAMYVIIALLAINIMQAVGVRLGYFTEVVATFITTVIIAFYYSWSLTLLILCFMPFMMITMAFRGRMVNGETTISKKGYEESSYVSWSQNYGLEFLKYFHIQIAYEAIANIKTVASFNLEEKMENLFKEKLHAPHKYACS